MSGTELRALRLASGLTISELEESTGILSITILRFEEGKKELDKTQLLYIQQVCNDRIRMFKN